MSICAVEQLFDIYSSHIPIMFPKKQKFQQGRRVGLSNPKILVLLLFQKYYFTFFRDSWTGMTDNSGQERWILSHTHTNTHTHTQTHTHTNTHTHTHRHIHFCRLWSAPSTFHIWVSFPSGCCVCCYVMCY